MINMLNRREMLLGSALLTTGLCLSSFSEQRDSKRPAVGMLRCFKPGEIWLDTAGKPIQAHGASIIKVGDLYYWYGENKERTDGVNGIWHSGVRCYSLRDLYNWDDVGIIIPPEPDNPSSPLHPNKGMDRPHILYHAESGHFVC